MNLIKRKSVGISEMNCVWEKHDLEIRLCLRVRNRQT